jgi:hypothetical protein
MPDQPRDLAGRYIYEYSAEGPPLGDDRDAVALVNASWNARATFLAIPVERLAADFFHLRSGLVGAFLQKLVIYPMPVAIVGDLSAHIAASKALRDFVYECNRGRDCWFVANIEDVAARLEARGPMESQFLRRDS